ncbi:MAG: hypothetical protein ACRDR6_10700 [Pseudonocardiaceae bacterium]
MAEEGGAAVGLHDADDVLDMLVSGEVAFLVGVAHLRAIPHTVERVSHRFARLLRQPDDVATSGLPFHGVVDTAGVRDLELLAEMLLKCLADGLTTLTWVVQEIL